MLSGEDVLGCASFKDSIGVNGWPIEAHVSGDVIFRFPPIPQSRGYNELPYRMLVPDGVDNLLVAGRCASMTHEGQSAARVSGACLAMGEAAGTAAALALSGNTIPRDIAVEKLQQGLSAQGAFIGRDQPALLVYKRHGGGLMKGFLRLAFAGLLAVTASGIARAEDALKAKIGVLRLSSSAPVFIAQDKGCFREAGLDVELKFFDAAQPIAVATTSGDVDFGITAFTAGLYNLAGKGTLKVIGGMSREKAGYPLIGYFASNNAHAAGLQTPKDLAGKRVAVTQVGSSFHYSLGLLADKYGFKLSEVKVLPLQSLSNAAAALKGETIDAALLPVSTARPLMETGGAKFLGWVGDETPWQLGAVFASPKTLTNKPLLTKLLAALVRADREYHDVILAAVMDGKAPIDEKTKPLLDIIAKYTNLPVEQVVGNCAYIDPDGKLDVNNVANQIVWLQEQGFVDKGFDADAIIAKDYVKPD
jgi:NitT/TauT family transport system substrate-binding protein